MSYDRVSELLQAYGAGFDRARTDAMGSAGGFSGAEFWQLSTDHGVFCLRKWPPQHPHRDQLRFIHAVLGRVAEAGLRIVPVPLLAEDGCSIVERDGHLWELTPWMPGEADYCRHPSPLRLEAALTALARFHQAAANEEGFFSAAVSPGILQRSAFLHKLRSDLAPRIARRVGHRSHQWPELDERAGRLLKLFESAAETTSHTLANCAGLQVPLQPCIRDIWHDHVLFQGDVVSGIVDFGAMRSDNVATDIARLLGSLARDDRTSWAVGLEAYQQIRPLTPDELQMVGAFDASSVTLSGLNWLKWIYLDGRQFEDRRAVECRLDEIIGRF